MSLIRVQTTWTGVAGSPYYTNLYALGPLATNNGNDLADAWRTFLVALTARLGTGLVATIDSELLEFDETTGNVTGAGSDLQTPVTFTGTGDVLPRATQGLLRWQTAGIVHNRRVRGRTFIPGVLEADNDSQGLPATSLTGAVQVAANAMLVTMSGRMRIWSQPFEGTDTNPPRPGSAHEVTGAQVWGQWASLRSRRD